MQRFAPSGSVNPQFAQNSRRSTVHSPPCRISFHSTLWANMISFESCGRNYIGVVKMILPWWKWFCHDQIDIAMIKMILLWLNWYSCDQIDIPVIKMILLWQVWATVNHVCHIVYPYKPIKNFICYCQGDFVWCVHISLCFYQVIETRVKVWENSKKLWKHSLAVRVPTDFLFLPNFHLCFYNSKETRKMFSIS